MRHAIVLGLCTLGLALGCGEPATEDDTGMGGTDTGGLDAGEGADVGEDFDVGGVDAEIPDAGEPDTDPGRPDAPALMVCGHSYPLPSEACATCLDENCCDPLDACVADSECEACLTSGDDCEGNAAFGTLIACFGGPCAADCS